MCYLFFFSELYFLILSMFSLLAGRSRAGLSSAMKRRGWATLERLKSKWKMTEGEEKESDEKNGWEVKRGMKKDDEEK